MGQRLRHYGALMKKNWIIWKRNLGASICELICPIALMAILSLARLAVSADQIAASSNVSESVIYKPVDYYAAQDIPTFEALQQQDAAKYKPLFDFVSLNSSTQEAYIQNRPISCGNFTDENWKPLIAFAGDPAYTTSVVQSLKNTYQKQLQYYQLLQSNPQTARQSGLFSTFVTIPWNFTQFSDHQSIVDYIQDPNYMVTSDRPGLCYAFSIDTSVQDQITVNLIFDAFKQDGDGPQSIPDQLQNVWSEFITMQDTKSFGMYANGGYSHLQYLIANSILRQQTNNSNASIALAFVPFKADAYISDDFDQILSAMLPFFMLLMFILPVYRLISSIVAEKESKARESMKMMGLSDLSYWASWFTYYLIIVLIISIICTIILSANVFRYTNRGIIFLYFFIYGLSLFGLCTLITAFFSRARVAAITGTLIYFGTSFINAAVQDPNTSSGAKNLASLLTTVAVSLAGTNLANFESNGVGLTMDNINSTYNNYKFSSCLIIMVISLFITFFLGIYLENILPSAYGLRKKCCFCCMPSYWCGQERRRSLRNNESVNEDLEIDDFESKGKKKENFEGVARDLLQQEKDGKILKIEGLQKKFSNGFHAVKGLNIKMYTNQIFALLGHNGAGKTTTISMLTGLLEPTQGQCEVFGTDLFQDMDSVRQSLGVCPQHDILFDLLTPEEHLDIFCDFKGLDRSLKKAEIQKMIKDVGLYSGKDIIASKLSGGNRRKLSVAIALIGGSKFVLLDEPTAGMDLSARRRLWNMLKNYKHNRIVILTTHYMDEADILGDRIGIMAGGELMCLGSSLFLKNRFGVGYNLTMVKLTKEENTKVGPYLKERIGDVKFLSEVSSEITFQIPTALSHKFTDFFQNFDRDLPQLGIESYGVSVTTLEEVFLKVAEGDDTNDDHKVKQSLKHQISRKETMEDYSVAEQHEVGTCNVFQDHLSAQFRKRFYLYRRNFKGLIIEVFVPVLLVLLGLGLSKVKVFFNVPDRILTPDAYPQQRMIVNGQTLLQSSNNSDLTPQQIIQNLPRYTQDFVVTYNNSYSTSMFNGNLSMVCSAFDNNTFDARLIQPYEPYRYGHYFVLEANNATKQFQVLNWMNLTSQDAAAFWPAFMYQAIIKSANGNPNFQLNMITNPFPLTNKLESRAQANSGVFIVFVVSIGFALIPSAMISFIVNEREKNLKHMQLISGMNLSAYWISNMLFDIVKGIIPCAIVIGLIYAFQVQYDWVWILFLLFPIGVTPFTYVTSFLFKSENMGQTVTIFVNFVIAGIGAIVAVFLRLFPSTQIYGDVLVWIFKIFPLYCLTDSIMYQSFKSALFLVRPNLITGDFNVMALGGDILVIMLHFIFWSFLLVVIELGAFDCCRRLPQTCNMNKVKPRDDLELDDDVLAEEKRVEETSPQDMRVRVNKFRKVYTNMTGNSLVAVEKTSFGLDYGECFALLGVNGAGKSTTFKSLTYDIEPTAGELTINGLEVKSNFSTVRKQIGYCPQYDVIFDLMTVEEHLDYYSRLKGILKEKRKELIEKQIQEMNLQEHRHKPAGTLSGGNKRKLSVAVCVIGNPPIILLDEPSAGMDPEARRFMWQVVARISQERKKSAVVLTTHSMEEAEALSTKMGIMVKGGIFRCFGSSQHIKNKFGTGYEIEVKVRKIVEEELKSMVMNYGLQAQEEINITDIPQIMKSKLVDDFLTREVKRNHLGNDLVLEADLNHGMVGVNNFINWLYIEMSGVKILEALANDFEQVEILEHYSDYYKFRVPRGSKTIGFVFSFIEQKKREFNISEYSASQTTLEQIFQTFANLNIDDDKGRKFALVQGNLTQITEDKMAVKSIVEEDGIPLKGQTAKGSKFAIQ